jgi:translation initiation factor IF-3
VSKYRKTNYSPRTYHKTNWAIRALKVRLLDAQGKQIGILPIQEARDMAQAEGLDLVEIVQKANPPIVKLIKFSKFKYLEKKKLKTRTKKSGGGLKEVRLTPFIGQKDLETRLEKMQKFLTAGHKVKISIKFVGRQITRPEFGHRLVERLQKDLSEVSVLETKPKLVGKRMYATFSPTKIKAEKNEKITPQTQA